MEKSLFEQIASSLTVGSICSPMAPDIPSDVTAEALKEFTERWAIQSIGPLNIDANGDFSGIMWSTDHFNASASFADNDTVTEGVAGVTRPPPSFAIVVSKSRPQPKAARNI
jgi:hypothetical protein